MKQLRLIVLVICTVLFTPAQAGRSCEAHPVQSEALHKALRLALEARNALEQSGAQIALVARVGRDLSRHGLRYSHLGFAWRDHPQGPWLMVHKLNDCGLAEGHLYTEGLGNFFADDLFAFESWIVVPREPVQTRLIEALGRNQGMNFHHAPYNLVAYPFSIRYQNSNQWALELLASAMSESSTVTDRSSAQVWLKNAGYQPTRLHLGPLTRLGGRMFKANIAFDDHPPELRWSNRIDTITVESIYGFLMARDAVLRSLHVQL